MKRAGMSLPCAMNCDCDSRLDWKRKKESISISLMKMLNVQQKEGQDLTRYLSSVSTRQLQKESSRVSDQCWTLDSTCASSSVCLSVCCCLPPSWSTWPQQPSSSQTVYPPRDSGRVRWITKCHPGLHPHQASVERGGFPLHRKTVPSRNLPEPI